MFDVHATCTDLKKLCILSTHTLFMLFTWFWKITEVISIKTFNRVVEWRRSVFPLRDEMNSHICLGGSQASKNQGRRDGLTLGATRRVAVEFILAVRTVGCAVTPSGTRHAAPFLSAPERLWGTGLRVLAFLVRPVRTILSPVTHEEPTDAYARWSTLKNRYVSIFYKNLCSKKNEQW